MPSIKYFRDLETDAKIRRIAETLKLEHDLSRIVCVRSTGSKSKRTLARCHALPKIMQLALDVKAHYAVEIVSENFDRLNEKDKTRTLIHELMHIPKGMKGGFRHHDYVCTRNIENMYKIYKESILRDINI